MKRLFFLSSLFILFSLYSADAQNKKHRKWDDQPFKYEVRIGWASTPYSTVYSGEDYKYVSEVSYLDNLFKTQEGPMYATGGMSAQFCLNFRDWFTLAFDASFNDVWRKTYDPADDEYGRINGVIFNIMPVARFDWVRKPVFRMYTAVGMGFSVAGIDDATATSMSFYIAPLGLSIGKRVFGFIEWGGGYNCNMVGIRGGVGVKF